MQHTEALLNAGGMVILAALAIPNIKAFAYRITLLGTPTKPQPKADWSKFDSYVTWVTGLTLLVGLYNLTITRDLQLVFEVTAVEFIFLAAGLSTVILYKKDKPKK